MVVVPKSAFPIIQLSNCLVMSKVDGGIHIMMAGIGDEIRVSSSGNVELAFEFCPLPIQDNFDVLDLIQVVR